MTDHRVTWGHVSVVVVVPVVLAGLLLAVGAGWLRADGDTGTPTVAPSTEDDPGYAFWATRDDGSPVRWNPCEPIRWTFDPDGAPRYGGDLVDEAVAVVAAATGLRFQRLPDRAEEPALDRPLTETSDAGRTTWAPVLVTWALPGTGELPLRTSDRAVAVPVSVGGVFVTGQVVLNRERDDLAPVMGDRSSSWGATLVHELGHLVGLDHIDDKSELMSRFPGEGPATFGDGDLAGLALLGADAGGCLDAGPPREVTVDVQPRT